MIKDPITYEDDGCENMTVRFECAVNLRVCQDLVWRKYDEAVELASKSASELYGDIEGFRIIEVY